MENQKPYASKPKKLLILIFFSYTKNNKKQPKRIAQKKKKILNKKRKEETEIMLSKESGIPNDFGLPEEVLEVLPPDPFEQLDVARKITSIALSTRIASLESEASVLRHNLAEKDDVIADLQSQLESLDAALSDASDKLSRADQEKEDLKKENETLANAVKKLNRDVAKLEAFRKTLMRSLQDDEDHSAGSNQMAVSAKSITEEDASLTPSRTPSMRSQYDIGSSYSEDTDSEAPRPRISPGLLLASQTSTPKLSPPISPPSQSASVSPTRTPKPLSPRRHSISISSTRGLFEDRASFSLPSSTHSSMSGLETGSQSGRTRVDGKEFFRQVRSRLSYEQFGAFLANVKDLNSHKQTKEETLRKASEIFGPENKDLYAVFEGLITRNVQ
ncbi:OLC1v1020263C1 [Oldenlandia corymbosa var. corymbosa]|uniref:OLC1v1020263C1 n=1 Tax=Oldenlandia corymbosa var. corymbosa TaxID=529605 RepID=A0AAV1EGH6_OLDCO|nr:OLC1v1020263C1 [Oldenlandia corymbosa var. corymbosa]